MEAYIILQAIIYGLLMGGIYALISIGLTMIYGVMSIVNFAHQEFVMLALYVTFWLFAIYGVDPYVSMLVSVPLLFALGFLIQKLLIDPILKAPHLNQILLTVGLMIFLQNAALIFWKADYRAVTTSYSGATIPLGNILVSIPRFYSFLVVLIITVMFYVFLTKTDMGLALRAIVQDKSAAALMGINVSRMYSIAFALSAALAAIGAALLSPVYYVYPTVGNEFALIMWVIVVLGGLGSFFGAFIGGLIVGVVGSLGGLLIGSMEAKVVLFIIFILILLFKPLGLLGKKM